MLGDTIHHAAFGQFHKQQEYGTAASPDPRHKKGRSDERCGLETCSLRSGPLN
jgi:hypothetical protein